MLRPFLFVGIGGSGGKTLRALKQTLGRRLRQENWDKGIPGSWQFVQVDTAYDGAEFPAPMLPLKDFIGLVGPGEIYETVRKAIESRFNSSEERNLALSGWLLQHAGVPITTGAGQVRTIGRAVSAAKLADLREGLKGAVDNLQAPSNRSDLIELSMILHPKTGGAGKMLDPVVIVVSSIAGGSGAGMLLDVTETLKSVDPNANWLQEQLAFLYTPEVFDSIAPEHRTMIPMNALGAMNEILAGLWANEESQASKALFDASGVQVLRQGKKAAFGPAGVYLIGSKNANGVNIAKGTEGAGMDEVFLAVGEAIAGLITDENLSAKYNAYFYTNVFANSGKEIVLSDKTGLRRTTDSLERMPFGALGFARITLGMDRLTDYASEGLAREQIQTMLFPRFEPVDPLNPIPNAEHIERAVNAQRDDFIQGSHLNEVKPHDQVVNYFRGDGIDVPSWDAAPGTQQEAGARRKRQAQEYARSCVPANAQRPDKTHSAAQWRTMLSQQASTRLPEFLAEQQKEIEARTQLWSEEIQQHLVDFTARYIARAGLQVTAALLKILRDDLQQVATQEMPAEAESMRSRGADWQKGFAGRLDAASALDANSKEVSQALQAMQLGAERLAEAQLLENVPALLKNINKSVLEPLIEECETAYSVLGQEVNPARDTGSGRLFKEFAVLRDDRSNKWVAPRYRPRQVEKMMIEPDTFPAEFETLMKMDLPDEDKTQWAQISKQWSMQGIPLRSRDARIKSEGRQTLMEVETPWVPEDFHARRDSTLGPQALQVRLPMTIQEIVERDRTWLEDGESSFGRQYRMPLGDFCKDGSKKDQLERQQAFLSAFTDLLQLSAPLISLNDNAIREFHSNPDPTRTPFGIHLQLTEIPFAKQSETGKSCVNILIQSDLDADSFTFEAASTRTDIFAFSTLKSAMSPMVFSSLIDPIAQAWLSASGDAKAVHSFWEGRRARPLTDALPIPPEIRMSMIVGWFVSFMFGQRKKDMSNEKLGVKWEIWDPQASWVAFPYPLLPAAALDRSPLPAILTSLSLAIVQAGKLSSTEPLIPYMRLKHVGREITTNVRFAVDLPDPGTPTSELIRDWVATGTVPSGAPTDFNLATGDNGKEPAPTTMEERRGVITKQARRLRDEYEGVWVGYEGKTWNDLPNIYELKDDITDALTYIVQYCETLSVGGISFEDN